MKLVVAIYQNKNQIDQYLDGIGIKHTDILEAGPFSSQQQAVEWAEYMGTKPKSDNITHFTLGFLNKHPWYGAIFQWEKSPCPG